MKLLPVTLTIIVSLLAVSHVFGEERKEDERPPYYLTDAELDKKLGIDEKTEAVKEHILLIYFHRTPGCVSCQVMAKYVYETVEKRFADEAKKKQVVLRYRDLDDRQNADLIRRFNVRSPNLFVVQIRDGRMVRAKPAGRIWSLIAEKDKFIDYVEEEVKSYQTLTEPQS
jgi:thiol-disulfide isomerase/thioredoxin